YRVHLVKHASTLSLQVRRTSSATAVGTGQAAPAAPSTTAAAKAEVASTQRPSASQQSEASSLGQLVSKVSGAATSTIDRVWHTVADVAAKRPAPEADDLNDPSVAWADCDN